MVRSAQEWAWSSAVIHCGEGVADGLVSMRPWVERWNAASWKEYLSAGETESELRAVRASTYTGRPLGTEEFVLALEEATHRALAPRKGGRPAKKLEATSQSVFNF
jgi:putative transposase